MGAAVNPIAQKSGTSLKSVALQHFLDREVPVFKFQWFFWLGTYKGPLCSPFCVHLLPVQCSKTASESRFAVRGNLNRAKAHVETTQDG